MENLHINMLSGGVILVETEFSIKEEKIKGEIEKFKK